MEYYEIYKKRLNHYGFDYQSRIQTKREKEFRALLARSVYRIDFKYKDDVIVASFEKYKQDNTETLHYLLTELTVQFEPGTILEIPDKDGVARPWMVYWLENIQASGYNRYVLLRMTHFLEWTARDGTQQTSWAYMYGQEDNMLKNEIRSRSRMDTLYSENLKLSFFVMPVTPKIRRDDYFIIGEKPLQEYYRVTGYDIQSTPGVEFVSVDPIYEFDLTAPPERETGDDPKDFYWLEAGQQEDDE